MKRIPHISDNQLLTWLSKNGPQYVDIIAMRLGSPSAEFQQKIRYRLRVLRKSGLVITIPGDDRGSLWTVAPASRPMAKVLQFPAPFTVALKKAA